MIKKRCGLSRSTCFLHFFHMGSRCCHFPDHLVSSTYTDRKRPCWRCAQKHSQFRTFSHLFQHNVFKLPFPAVIRQVRDHADFAQEEQLVLQCWTMILATCVVVDVSRCLEADTASAACLAHPGTLATTSITFAAVISEAGEPCSVNTA